ncbi:hypothetical protein [Nocardioides jensenii]|uniref:hypothetical protein n=1 Tax=Nocardioides jensenii TaxID=1843 RepID=UPI0008297A0E|nr:hypothetical protein [Nocardioides jensenii]
MRTLLAALVATAWLVVGAVIVGPVSAVPARSEVAEPDVTVQRGTGFSAAQLREIRELVAEARIPTRVRILARLPKAADASPQLHAQHLELARFKGDRTPGLTLVYSPGTIPEYGGFETVPKDERDVTYSLEVAERLAGPARARFVELVRMGTTRTGAERFDEELAKIWEDPEVSDSGSGSRTEPPSTKVKVARWAVLVGAVVLVLLVVVFRARAIGGWWRRRGRARGLEEAADRAQTKNLADQAKADVMAFGAAIDAERMDEHDALELWNLALDDYDQASRLLDAARAPADHEKVIVICARGRGRLASAQR